MQTTTVQRELIKTEYRAYRAEEIAASELDRRVADVLGVTVHDMWTEYDGKGYTIRLRGGRGSVEVAVADLDHGPRAVTIGDTVAKGLWRCACGSQMTEQQTVDLDTRRPQTVLVCRESRRAYLRP